MFVGKLQFSAISTYLTHDAADNLTSLACF